MMVMEPDRIKSLKAGYEEVADAYVEKIYGELAHKPLDRELLDAFAAELKSAGVVCDLGCGPGHLSRYLRDRGVDVMGLDLTEGMLAHARRLNPDIPFVQGDMTALTEPDGAWAGIVAFYSLIHVPHEEMADALRGLRRVLRGGAPLFMAFHLGDEHLHVEDLFGHRVSLDFFLYRSEEMSGHLRSAGFEVERVTERDPYPDVEYPSRRSYILARRPA
jgi:SAM-dependent methyltransferase